MNTKRLALLMVLTILLSIVSVSSAWEDTSGDEIIKRFPHLKFQDHYTERTKKEYYRFSIEVPCFDPFDLNYFPHETWAQADWGTLGRWSDTYGFYQMLLVSEPAGSWVFHGTSPGKDYGYSDDFYFYASLFVTDSYPDDGASCYVYYSDSLTKGFGESHGLLIDPESGIYRVANNFKVPYNLTNKTHELNIVAKLDPADYELTEENMSSSAIGATGVMDRQFTSDWNQIKSSSHMPGSTVRAYRVELIRELTHLKVYINGVLAAELDDEIGYENDQGRMVPNRVSWSYGPVLYSDGLTTTCITGDVAIRDTGRVTGYE